MQKIRKGDNVIVTTGRDKGRTGTVVRVLGERVLVENINTVKRHQRPNPAKGIAGAIVQKEASIHVSNIALMNPATRKPDRIGVRTLADGRKVRFFKSNSEVVDA